MRSKAPRNPKKLRGEQEKALLAAMTNQPRALECDDITWLARKVLKVNLSLQDCQNYVRYWLSNGDVVAVEKSVSSNDHVYIVSIWKREELESAGFLEGLTTPRIGQKFGKR